MLKNGTKNTINWKQFRAFTKWLYRMLEYNNKLSIKILLSCLIAILFLPDVIVSFTRWVFVERYKTFKKKQEIYIGKGYHAKTKSTKKIIKTKGKQVRKTKKTEGKQKRKVILSTLRFIRRNIFFFTGLVAFNVGFWWFAPETYKQVWLVIINCFTWLFYYSLEQLANLF
jgi:hypothetical protein